MSEVIRCRATLVPACYDGEPSGPVYDDDEEDGVTGMAGDGTWDGQSVICDPCYIALEPFTPSGRCLTSELRPETIEIARIALASRT